MSSVLIVYASTHGHTAKVADAIAGVLGEAGHDTKVRDSNQVGRLQVSDYDAAIVGASVHNGHHQHELMLWARRHATALGDRPSAFFSLCLAAADDSDESRQATQEYLDDFADDTGWTPDEAITFAGALQYREYDAPTRLVMRLLMAHGHRPTDVSRDYDYTDWNAVSAFARRFGERLAGAAVTPQPRAGRAR